MANERLHEGLTEGHKDIYYLLEPVQTQCVLVNLIQKRNLVEDEREVALLRLGYLELHRVLLEELMSEPVHLFEIRLLVAACVQAVHRSVKVSTFHCRNQIRLIKRVVKSLVLLQLFLQLLGVELVPNLL